MISRNFCAIIPDQFTGKIRFILFLFCFYVLVLFPGISLAATYYLDPNGSDSNAGTQTQPWKTIQKGANSAQPGDTVLVNDGYYTGFYTVRSGTNSAPITFKAIGNGAILNQNNGNTPDIINIEGTDHVVIDGFIVKDGDRAGIRIVNSIDVVVKNNTVGPNTKWGIFSGFAPHIQILDNITFNSSVEHGIYISNSNVLDDNPLVRGNESYGNHANGIQFNGDCYSTGDGTITGAIIENNRIHDNGYKGFSLISLSDSVIQNNLIYNNGTRGGGAGGIHLTDEPGCGKPSSRNVVVNNTIVEPRITGIRLSDGPVGNILFNNIVVSKTPIADEDGGNSIDEESNITRNSVEDLFIAATEGNYHLSSNSAAIDSGRISYTAENAPSNDFEGVARPGSNTIEYDSGAYEYGDGIPLFPPKNLRVTD